MSPPSAAARVELPVARVVIIPAAGDLDVLDYSVPESLDAVALPGARVVVPLGTRRAVGVITERTAGSSFAKLRALIGVLDRQRLIEPAILDLCRWMADYYLCTFGDALTTALPGSVQVQLTRMVEATEPPPASATLRDNDAALVEWVRANGPVPIATVEAQVSGASRVQLLRLQRGGWIHMTDELQGTGGPTKHERWYRAARDLTPEEQREWSRRRPAQYAVYEYLHRHPLRRARSLELQTTFPNCGDKLKALVEAGLVQRLEEEVYRPTLPDAVGEDRPVELSPEQQTAVAALTKASAEGFHPFLLWGVTGSGKTEVYLRCVATCLAAGRSALVLVPEISLTHQVVDRVRARFGDRVAVLHSSLSDGERWDEWRKIARAEAPIVVGARSAVFAPMPRLGLIVVDEEHDSAYKQDDGIRYNGRDVAVMRAKRANCPIVLGSATPSMETFHNARSNRYGLLTLSQRVESRPLPQVDLVDLRRSGALGKALLISGQLSAALQANLVARGQSLVFLNRRGFANFLQCHQCGEALMCPNCSVTLTLHRRLQGLRCHHCDYSVPIPTACSSCGGLSLGAWGAGTEQVEAALRKLLPGARIGRMDRDTTSRKGAMVQLMKAWQQREYDVLVGTQMVTKGHDVPGVTLVGVLLADLSLNLPDLRAAERTFQLLTQVAGRAGRGTQPGRVIVQTLQPNHFSLQCAMHHDFRAFAEQELAGRRETGYPPFARLVLVRCEGESADATEKLARAFAEQVRKRKLAGVTVLGPTPSPIERLRRRFRWQLLLRGSNGAALRNAARYARDALRKQVRSGELRLIVDVDPYSMM